MVCSLLIIGATGGSEEPGAGSLGYHSLLSFGLAIDLERLAACFRVCFFQLEEGNHVSTQEPGERLVVKSSSHLQEDDTKVRWGGP